MADELDEAPDWLESFRDVHFSWEGPERERVSTRARWWLGESDPSSNGELPDEGPDERDALEPRVWTLELPEPDEAPEVVEERPARRSGRRAGIVTAIVVLLLVVAVGVAAFIGAGGGADSDESEARTAETKSSRTTTSAAVTTTTIAPAPPSAPPPSAAPVAPSPFRVRSNVAVRDQPTTSARQVGTLNGGETVQVECSTRGESVGDSTGQRSDVWYRLVPYAGFSGYASGLYLEGPAVRDCA